LEVFFSWFYLDVVAVVAVTAVAAVVVVTAVAAVVVVAAVAAVVVVASAAAAAENLNFELILKRQLIYLQPKTVKE
jgi:hypothetical protein